MSDESDESNEEEYEKIGSESGSACRFGTVLEGLLCGLRFPLGVTIYDYESFDGGGGSLALPYKNIGEAGTGGGGCTKWTDSSNISSFSLI